MIPNNKGIAVIDIILIKLYFDLNFMVAKIIAVSR